MDQTLYYPAEADPYLAEGAEGEWRFICDRLALKRADAEILIKAKRCEVEARLGRATSLTSALVELGVSKRDWDRIRTDCYFPEKHIGENTRLRSALEHARGRATLCVFTNSPKSVAKRVVKAVGIHDLDLRLIGVDEVSTFKPDPDAFLEAAHSLGIQPQGLVSVGDRRDIDCLPPLEAGYGGAVHVAGPDEVIEFCQIYLR